MMSSYCQAFFRVFLFGIIVAFFSTYVLIYAAAPAEVLIVHQARGTSCCDPGSLAHTRRQIADAQTLGIPVHIALRYDALQDPAYVQLITTAMAQTPTLIYPAAFLEIIPTLAHDAGVAYTAKPEHWYKAEAAYTVGYALPDREKLLQTYMAAYKQAFGTFPLLTVGWIMDTHSLNILHDTYGVQVHEITREQPDTDSYSLQGCPWHYPYPASRQWACIPDYTQANGLMIVRQTLTDPLFNYGDTSSSFTGQPNDYARGGHTIAYFKKLADAAIQSPGDLHPGYMTLGIENSMDIVFQDEFRVQLDYLTEKNTQDQTVRFIRIEDIGAWRQHPITIISREEDGNTAWSITTPHYRARVTYNLQRNYLAITDLRGYQIDWKDPLDTRITHNGAYWTVPAVVDASRWRNAASSQNDGHDYMSPPLLSENEIRRVPVDYEHIHIPRNGKDIPFVNEAYAPSGAIMLAMYTREGKHHIIPSNIMSFSAKDRTIMLPHGSTYRSVQHALQLRSLPLAPEKDGSWNITDSFTKSSVLQLESQKNNAELTILPPTAPELDTLRTALYPWYYPENYGWTIDMHTSSIEPFNRFAVVGRNPIVITVIPRDRFMQEIYTDTTPHINTNIPEGVRIQKRMARYQRVDIHVQDPGIVHISATYKNAQKELQTWAIAAPNCKADPWYCVTHPHHALLYVGAMIEERFFKKE